MREVTSPDGDFTFEVVMKNGKKKLLVSTSGEGKIEAWPMTTNQIPVLVEDKTELELVTVSHTPTYC